MSQIRLRDYKEPLTSFNHNIMQFTRKPGRFVGFDTMVATGSLAFKLTHTGTGTSYKNEVQDTVGPAGVLMSKQGVFIIETEEITGFTVDTNAGNASDRTDLIVCNHQYVSLDGGQNATYAIIKGPIGDITPSNLTNPSYQFIVGRVVLPAGATNLSSATYITERCPDSGDGVDARLTDVNKFQTYNQFNYSPTTYDKNTYTETLGTSKTGWNFKDDANNFIISEGFDNNIDAIRVGKSSTQDGTTIVIQITATSTIRNNQSIPTADINRGYYQIVIPNQFANRLVDVSGVKTLAIIPQDGNVTWNVTLLKSNNQWLVINVEGNSASLFKKGMVIQADLSTQDIIDNFDSSGLGKNLYLGWQVCNGLRGTADRRARLALMATDAPADGAPALSSSLLNTVFPNGATGGESGWQKTLIANNLPNNFNLNITGKGIRKSGTSNGAIVLGTATVNGAGPDPTYGDFVITTQASIPGGGDLPLDVTPPWIATLDLMKL